MNMRSEGDGRSKFQPPSLKLVLLLVVVVGAAIFFFQNGEEAVVTFLGFEVEWPVRVVILISIVLGIVIDRLGSWLWRRSRSRSS